MTTHETDRPADYESVEEERDEMGGSDVLADEELDAHADTDAPVAERDLEEPVDDRDTTWSREDDDLDEDTDVEAAEPEPVDFDEDTDVEAVEPEAVDSDEAERIDTAPADRTPASDRATEKLAPVGPESAIDPGTGSYEDRWGAIQAGFIDDPRRTVESASTLVAEIWDEITHAITDEREGIDGRWHTTESSTDDLRVAMQDYRTLYARLMDFTSA